VPSVIEVYFVESNYAPTTQKPGCIKLRVTQNKNHLCSM